MVIFVAERCFGFRIIGKAEPIQFRGATRSIEQIPGGRKEYPGAEPLNKFHIMVSCFTI